MTQIPVARVWAVLPETRRHEAVRTLSTLLERTATETQPVTTGVGGECHVAG